MTAEKWIAEVDEWRSYPEPWRAFWRRNRVAVGRVPLRKLCMACDGAPRRLVTGKSIETYILPVVAVLLVSEQMYVLK